MRSMIFASLLVSLFYSSTAAAVDAKAAPHGPLQMPKVTTGAAVRAEVDVQIRRLHHMLVSNSDASEGAFDKLDKLEKERRGKH